MEQKFQDAWETLAPDSPVREKPSLRDWYTLAVLIVAYVLSFVDRQILSILVEPLKQDLHLSDTEVSLLQGLVFAVFLALAGMPLGRLVDTRRRVTIVAAGIAAWSIATASCAFASSYPSFLLCRMGVGVGEATLTPASHSIVADSVPRARLGFALGVFGIGSYIGSGIALLIGAGAMAWLHGNAIGLPVIGSLKPWQSVFLIVGLPGLLIAAWAATLREPRRRGALTDNSLSESWALLRGRFGSLLTLNFTAALTAMAVYAMGAWVPSFLIRSFDWSAPQAGTAYGLVVIGCGIAGVVGGGALGDLAVARGLPAGRLMVMAASSLCAAPFATAAMLAADGRWSVALLVPATLLTTVTLGILPSAQQAIVPGQVRGVTASLGVLMVNVIGLGIGPTVIALITDLGLGDPKLIRYALALALPLMLIASALVGLIAMGRYSRAEKHAGID